jgi:hypothetical protein
MPQWLGRHKWLWLTAAVMLIGLLAFVACEDDEKEGKTPTGGQTPAAQGPLKIGYLLDFTGALASFGPEEENAIKLAVKQINDAGGVLGEPVEIVKGDSGTDKDIGVGRPPPCRHQSHAIVGSLASGVTWRWPRRQDRTSFRSPASCRLDKANNASIRTHWTRPRGRCWPSWWRAWGSRRCTMYVNNASAGAERELRRRLHGRGHGKCRTPDQTAADLPIRQQCVAGDPAALVASLPRGAGAGLPQEALENDLIDQFVFVDGTKDDEMFGSLGWRTLTA